MSKIDREEELRREQFNRNMQEALEEQRTAKQQKIEIEESQSSQKRPFDNTKWPAPSENTKKWPAPFGLTTEKPFWGTWRAALYIIGIIILLCLLSNREAKIGYHRAVEYLEPMLQEAYQAGAQYGASKCQDYLADEISNAKSWEEIDSLFTREVPQIDVGFSYDDWYDENRTYIWTYRSE